MQQEKYQHPILNFEAGGPVLVSAHPQQQPTAQKTSLFFGGGLLLLVGAAGGLFLGNYFEERKLAETQDALKLEKLQRAATQQQIKKFCSENLGR